MMPPGLIAYQLAKATTPRGTPGGSGPQRKVGAEILVGYPQTFSAFIGQTMARTQILTAIKSASLRKEPLAHMLLASGQAGIGKTALSRLTASVLHVGLVELSGVVTEKDAIAAVRVMEDGDVLFLDEVHRLVSRGKSKAEWLLTLLQDGELHTPMGVIQAPRITVIAATTDAQKLPETILDRFPLKPVLEPYTDSEAKEIAALTAKGLGFGEHVPMPEVDTWLTAVARAANNNPRRIGMLLRSVLDIAVAGDGDIATEDGYDISLALEWNGLTEDGITRVGQEYLVGLFVNGGTAGAQTMKHLLNEEQLIHTEKQLTQMGLIDIEARGRTLTEVGVARARELAESMMSKMEASA
jgi:Holliday junction DNA helicase RuvB